MPRIRRWFFRSRRARNDRRRTRRTSPDRRQRVRFRVRYAAARLKYFSEVAWIASRLTIVAAVMAWGAGFLWNAWKSSDYFRVRDVRFVGDIPPKLPGALPLRSGMGLFSFDSGDLSASTRNRFVELESLDIGRSVTGDVIVRGRFRTPVAILADASVPTALDASGVAFPMPASFRAPKPLPLIEAPARDRAALMTCLDLWRRKLPAFFDVVKKLETDKMRAFRVELSDGVTVEWGELEIDTAVEKGRNVLRLKEEFSPRRIPARLRFVTEDRIVMDANWQPAAGSLNEGESIVKT